MKRIRLLIACLWCMLLTCSAYAAEREVRFQSDGVTIVGTLTAPNSNSRSPALLMIPGSGTVDRNGNGDGLNTDLYRHLAYRLAELGYVTLRYDKRGVGASKLPQNEEPKTTLSQLARDALAALNTLRLQPEVNPQRIGILGYEEGALIGMALASEAAQPPKVLVCLAAPGRTPAIILRSALAQRWRRVGVPPDKIQQRLSDFDHALVALYYNLPLPPLHEDVAPYFLIPVRAYLQEFYFENPVARLKQVKIPVLLLYGALDQQVSAKEDGELLLKQAHSAGNDKVTLKILDGTAHSFKDSKVDGQDTLTNPQIPLAPSLVSVLKEWLSSNL